VKVKEIIELLERNGWHQVRTRGSYRQFHHPVKPGTVTVAGAMSKDLPLGTLKQIYRQAGLQRRQK
jgi:predicted RNA binding protein YcfA (HicA-like mRNA interferase family)